MSQRQAKGKKSKITNELVAELGELLVEEKKRRRDDFLKDYYMDIVAQQYYDSGQIGTLKEFRIKEEEYKERRRQSWIDAGRPDRFQFYGQWYDEQNKKGRPRETFESYLERLFGQQVKKSEPVHKPEPIKKSESRKLL